MGDPESSAQGQDRPNIIYPELSYKIIGAAYEVHKALGPGYLENVYEEALAHELDLRGLRFERQSVITVHYKGRVVGTHRLDLVVEGKIIVEIKAVAALNAEFKQQTLSYLKSTGLRLGLLVNFGASSVKYVRIAN